MKLAYEGKNNVITQDKLKMCYSQDIFTIKFLNSINLLPRFNILNCFKICISLIKVPVS